MYQVNAAIRGTAGLLQHSFGQVALTSLQETTKRRTGKVDYSLEWMDTMFVDRSGYLYEPATHIEGALLRAAAQFKMAKTKTWKDTVRAYVIVQPDEILHLRNGQPVLAPDETLLTNPTDYLSVSIMRVVVQRAAVARSRLLIAPGWELAFCIQVQDEQMRIDALRDILIEAGRAFGIGDYRPRYGRFEVTQFEVQ